MNNKKIIFGVSAIVIVAGIFIVSEKLTSVKPPEHRLKFFPAIEERHVTAIVINDGASDVRLEKQNGVWTVGNADALAKPESILDAAAAADDTTANVQDNTAANANEGGFYPADSALVQVAIEKILSLKKSELISENPANQASFEVDSASGMSVEIYVTGKSAPAGVLRIGKSGPAWNSNYVRLMGSDAVYVINGGLRYSLFTDIEQWRKKPEPEPEPEPVVEENVE
jgi:hypothetical protein